MWVPICLVPTYCVGTVGECKQASDAWSYLTEFPPTTNGSSPERHAPTITSVSELVMTGRMVISANPLVESLARGKGWPFEEVEGKQKKKGEKRGEGKTLKEVAKKKRPNIPSIEAQKQAFSHICEISSHPTDRETVTQPYHPPPRWRAPALLTG